MERSIFAIFSWLLSLLCMVLLGSSMGGMPGFLLGFGFWAILTALTVKLFLVSVPEVTGLLTVNYLTGELRPYGTGLNFKYPWEQVKDGNYINLRIVTQEFGKGGSDVETYPSADGPEMLVKWSFQYLPRLSRLDRYVAVDETTINKGLQEIGSSYLSAVIGSYDAEELRIGPVDPSTGQRMPKLQWRAKLETDMRLHFELARHKITFKERGEEEEREREGTLEELYGIDIKMMTLSDIDFNKKYQEARETDQIVRRLKAAAKHLQEGGDGSMTDGDAFNNVLIVSGKASKSVQAVEGAGAQAAVAWLMSIFGKK